ncbi:hypothetical protein OHA79_35560 [Streptomyces sp. NBC_00841]|uniref:hypothetical protein n=1 Tax=unclassified Streptomyces TaxID=2593676 RepID=UPI00225B190B|nr:MULTISPECIES: hypothetical protein [unclassified Streptomyces]MCX4531740.1 hypothetical protein [Streptomyces sp. NBC_01669]WSA02697.1 hypothetical protein OHA79_35560 [Streptomyces sp. NBC_00841]
MDQYDSQRPWGRHRHTEDDTPIYDRLLAEWQAARRDRDRASRPALGPPSADGLVPAARTSCEDLGE